MFAFFIIYIFLVLNLFFLKFNMALEDGVEKDGVADINKISLRLPNFWHDNPELYFAQVEANFQLSNITTESTKFCSLVASLDQQTMSVVSDLIRTPDKVKPYTVVKERLIKEYQVSQTERIKTLLQDLTLVDSKPSALLRRMRELAGVGFSDDVLKSIWLSRLPTSIQSILSVSTETLVELSGLADRIFEVTGFSAGCNEVEKSSSLEAQIDELRREVSALNVKIDGLYKNRNFQPRSRSRANSRNSFSESNSRQRNSAQSADNNADFSMCWYHRKFAEKAHACKKPCSYTLND